MERTLGTCTASDVISVCDGVRTPSTPLLSAGASEATVAIAAIAAAESTRCCTGVTRTLPRAAGPGEGEMRYPAVSHPWR